MTIVQLEYVLAVDLHRNFARAAEKCFVSQPTLSMQLQKLEDELGEKLFDRSKQPVIPTERGKKVIEQARKAVREFKRIPEIIRESRGEVSGELRLGIIPTVAPYLLPLFITEFLYTYPGVNLVVEELVTGEILKRLANDSIDAGIASTPLHDPAINEAPLYYEPVVAYVSAAHPLHGQNTVSVRDLEANDLWTLGEGHCFRSQVVNLCGKSPSKKQGGEPGIPERLHGIPGPAGGPHRQDDLAPRNGDLRLAGGKKAGHPAHRGKIAGAGDQPDLPARPCEAAYDPSP